MGMVDTILSRFKLRYEDLSTAERSTLHSWVDSLSKKQVTIEKVKDYLADMRSEVEKELIDEPEFHSFLFFHVPNRKQIYLKARLKNYMMLEALLISPDRLKRVMDEGLSNVV